MGICVEDRIFVIESARRVMEPAVTTAISAVREDNNSDGIAYALNECRAEKSAKGIVIKNGKKHIIK